MFRLLFRLHFSGCSAIISCSLFRLLVDVVVHRFIGDHERLARHSFLQFDAIKLKKINEYWVSRGVIGVGLSGRTWTEPRLVVRIVVTKTLDDEATLGPRRILLLSVVNSREMLSCDSRASSKSRWALRRWAFSRLTSSSASSSWRFRAYKITSLISQRVAHLKDLIIPTLTRLVDFSTCSLYWSAWRRSSSNWSNISFKRFSSFLLFFDCNILSLISKNKRH